MDELNHLADALREAIGALSLEVASVWFLGQIGIIVALAVVSWAVAALLRRRIDLSASTMGWPAALRLLVRAIADHFGSIIFALAAAATRLILIELTRPAHSALIGVAGKLATAWIAIVLIGALIRNQFLKRIVVVSAWIIAALSIVGLLGRTAQALDAAAIVFGGVRVSLLLVLETAGFLLVTLSAAVLMGNIIERSMRGAADLSPSIQVLLGKLVRLVLVTFAIVIVLSTLGIDLSALALFSGAVGVGIGFGLQKIVSNLFSGFVLLMDKSIKPGDVITVGETFGWVDSMGARYTSVVVRDGREILIPNEDLVTQRVINWSHSNDQVRLAVDFGVSYSSDPHQIRRVAVEAVSALPRILKKPDPVCHLTKFNDFSLDFTLRFWIRDPVDGVTNVRGDVLLALWDAFQREGIEIPFPVRDVRIVESRPATPGAEGTAQQS